MSDYLGRIDTEGSTIGVYGDVGVMIRSVPHPSVNVKDLMIRQRTTIGKSSDMFLEITGAKGGTFKGEASEPDFKGKVQIFAWSWGISSPGDMSTGGPSSRATLREVQFLKRVDSSSCALMGACDNNEKITKAVLTVRKAGTVAQKYFTVTLVAGRITSYDIHAPGSADDPEMLESFSVSFQKIDIDYRPQSKTGSLDGGMSYSGDTTP